MVEELLNTHEEENKDLTAHRTVVPLFSDVAGTVRVDCAVPEDVFVAAVMPRFWFCR